MKCTDFAASVASAKASPPNHDITVSGAGDIWGAIVGQNVTASGGSHLHYDESLANQRSAVFAVVPRSWTELTLY